MKKYPLVILFLFGSVLIACSGKEQSPEDPNTTDASLLQASSADVYSNGTTKLIKNARYRFQTKNVKECAEAIEAAVRKYPAYISGSDMKLENPVLENKMTIRVQNEFFQYLLKDIDKQAQFVNFRDVKTEDVAKQFVDLESRLNTKREVEKRYTEILRTKAGTVKEVLEAEQQIGTLHEEIEAAISRMNYLRDEIQYSTIELEFYQTVTTQVASNDTNNGQSFLNALTAGWNAVVVLCIVLVYIWPLVLIIGVACLFIYRRETKRGVVAQSGD